MASALYYNAFIPAFSNIGVPIAGAKLYFYYTETTDFAPVYADSLLTTPLVNPVVADLAGKFPDIYLDGDLVYKIVQTDSVGGTIGDAVDPYIPGTAVIGGGAALSGTDGASLIGTQDGEKVEGRLARYQLATIAALEALTPIDGDTAYLRLTGKTGTFVFSTADLSAEVASDVAQGVYVAPDSDATGASGAWVRQVDFCLRPEMFLLSGDSDDTNALQRSMNLASALNRPLYLIRRYVSSARLDLPSAGVTILGAGPTAGIEGVVGHTHILLYAFSMTGKTILRDFTLDGKTGGQLDAGMIQVAGSPFEFIDIDGLQILNGGVVGGAPPAGVNGIAVAGSTYPAGDKARIRIRNCHIRATTKAGINVTTLAEECWVENNYVSNMVGNNYGTAIQVNGARRVHVLNNKIVDTESSGIFVSSVGTTPPYGAQEVFIDGNVIINAGQLGTAHNEPYAIQISDANNTGLSVNMTVYMGVNVAISPWSMGLNVGAFNGRVIGQKLIVENATIGAYFQDGSHVYFDSMDFTNVNARNLTASSIAAIWVNNFDDLTINNVTYRNTAEPTVPEYIVFGTTAASNRVNINNIRMEGTAISGNVISAAVGLFLDSVFSWEDEVTVGLGSSEIVLDYPVADGQLARLETRAMGLCASSQSNQWWNGLFRSTGGACTGLNTAQPADYKGTGIATGLFFDTSGANLRQHFFAHSSEATTFTYNNILTLT